jgi:hypothetical protein
MEEGAIEVDSIEPIGFPDITPELARESGFLGLVDLLKVANHGKGRNIYLVRFHYVRPRRKHSGQRGPALTNLSCSGTKKRRSFRGSGAASGPSLHKDYSPRSC